jgi:hypothetical protein
LGTHRHPRPRQRARAEAPQTPEVNPDLLNRMNEFGSQLGEIKETLGQFQTGAEPQEPGFQYGQPDPGQQPYGPEQFGPEPQYGPEAGQQYVDEFGNPVPDGYGQPQPQMDPEQVAAQLRDALGLGNLESEVAQMKATRDAESLKQKYPDFADQEKVGKIRESVESAAWEIAGGDQAHAEKLMNSPAFWEREYLAGRARESAASETPAGGANEIQLETPGGTAPEQPEQDEGDLMVAAAERRKPSVVRPR